MSAFYFSKTFSVMHNIVYIFLIGKWTFLCRPKGTASSCPRFCEVEGLSLVAVVDEFQELFVVANLRVHGRIAFDLVCDRERRFLGYCRDYDDCVFGFELATDLGMLCRRTVFDGICQREYDLH
mgnify:CR=1 FL=1